MVDVVKPLPPEAGVLPAARRLYYVIALNRARIGLSCLAITMFAATYVDDSNIKAHRRIHAIEILIAAVCGVSFGAAKFKSTEFHEDEMQQEIRSTSSEIPVPSLPMRRASDKE